MTPLILKDLRLSLDALRPWALIVAGLAVGVCLLRLMPSSFVPRGIQDMTFAELLNVMGLLVGASAVAVAAWGASAVIQGDRRRGGQTFAHTMPMRGSRIACSKLFAILATALAPFVLAITLLASGWALMGTMSTVPSRLAIPLPMFGLAAFVGAALALFVAPLVRGIFSAVAIALLFGMGAATTAWLAEKVAFPFVAYDYLRTAAMTRSRIEVIVMDGGAATSAAIVGVVAAAVACAVVGTLALARQRSRRFMVMGGAVALSCAAVAGAITTAIVVPRNPVLFSWWAHWKDVASRASDAEIAAAVPRAVAATESNSPSTSNQARLDWALIEEGRQRLAALPIAARDASPIGQAFRRAEDYRQFRSAMYSLAWFVPLDDPRRLALVLDCILRYPSQGHFRTELINCLNQRGGSVEWPQEIVTDRATLQRYNEKLDSAMSAALQRLIDAGAPESDLMRRAIEVLRVPRADEWPGR